VILVRVRDGDLRRAGFAVSDSSRRDTIVSQQDPAPHTASDTGPDRTDGVGEHVPETPNSGDVDHLEGEFGELDQLVERDGGRPTTSDVPVAESSDADGA
jgi:hypothetical protein